MLSESEVSVRRREVVVDGTRLSYLHAGSGTPVLLLTARENGIPHAAPEGAVHVGRPTRA